MGLTYVEVTIANLARPRRAARLKFLVDSGTYYSVVPGAILQRLGIKRGKAKKFMLVDGSEVTRSISQALFRLNGDEAASPVIFGEEGDRILLGSVSLEALGLVLDPSSVNFAQCPCSWPPSDVPCSDQKRLTKPLDLRPLTASPQYFSTEWIS